MRRVFYGLMMLMVMGEWGWGQVSLTNASNSVTIEFNSSTPTTVGTNPSTAFTAAGFEPNPTTSGRLNSNAWAVTGWSDGSLAFGGTRTTATTDYTRGTTSAAVTTGGIYSYTGSPQSLSNPCLMIQPGGSDWAPGTLTLRIINNGSTNITSFSIAYNLYVRNDQARSNSFNFSYSTDDASYTSVGALDYSSPAALDANGWVLVSTSPSRSTSITGLNIAPSSYFYIRWSGADVSGSGSRDEFGLDSIAVSATFTSSNSSSSDIIRNTGFSEPTNITYASYQETDLTSSSLEVARFDIRDGGGSADADALATSLTAVTFSLSNWANVRRVAIYDGSIEISEVAVSSGTVTFSGLSGLSAADNGTKTFSLRASFNSTVTDNQQFQFTITSATADGAGSTFAAANAGGAASSPSGDANRIEVTATKLLFLQQPSNVQIGASMSPAVTVEATDANNNRDLDYATDVSITSDGTLSGTPVTAAPSSGLATFSTLTHTATGNSLSLTAASGSITSAVSNTFNVTNNSASDIIETPSYTYSSNIGYHVFQESADIQETETSIEVAGFRIRDGGAGADADAVGTTLTDISFTVTNPGVLGRAALYDGSTELAEVAVSGSPIIFTGFNATAPDNGTKDLTLRVSFTTTVTDNQQFQFTVSSVTASGTGSGFAAANGGGAQSSIAGDINRIEITATELVFSNEPTTVFRDQDFSLTVSTLDDFGKIDIDFNSSIILSRDAGVGTLSSATGLSQMLSSGTFTWNDLRLDTKENDVTLKTTNGNGISDDTTSAFDVLYITNIFIETIGNSGGTVTLADHESANGFDNDDFTMTQGGAANPADIRITNASSGYSGASGNSNVWFTSTSGSYGFAIEGVNASSYTNLSVQFGYRKESASELPALVLDYWNGSSYINVPFTFNEAANASAGWYLSPIIELPEGAQISNLRLRWVKSGTIAVRIDDIVLKGNAVVTGSSDIIAANNEPSNIAYATYQNAAINSTSDGVRVWSFTIRDGGGSADPDASGTILTGVTFGKGADNGVSSWANTIRRAALFDGTTKISEVSVTGETISFTGMSGSNVTAPDNGSKTLDLYLTFESTVTDNQQFQFKVTSASADGSGSGFAASDAGGAASSITGDRNRIEVTADRLTFFNEPSVAYQNDEFDLTVSATDAFGNVDADVSTSVSLIKNAGAGTLSSTAGLTQTLASGTYSWDDLLWNTIENNVSITSTNTGGLTNDITASFNVVALNLYTWNQSGSASYTVASNWTPNRNTITNTDVLQFNSGTTVTVTNVPTESIGKMIVTNNTTVNLQAGTSGNILTFDGLGSYDLRVYSGSQLNINGSNALTLFLNTNVTASINGSMTFSNAAHKLNAQTANAVRFRSGSALTQATGCTGNIFTNTGTANVAIFESGSKFFSQAGANPFGLSAPSSKVVFQTGSYYVMQQNSAPSLSGRTYANFETDLASFSQSPTGSSLLTVDSLIITQGTLNMNLTGGIHVKGDINVLSGNTLTFSPASANTITFNGTGEQQINGLGTLTFSSNANVTINKSDTLRLLRDVTLNKTLTLTKGIVKLSSGNALTISSSGNSSGGSNSSFVEGRMAKVFPVSGSSQNFQFRSGSRTNIQPVTVTLATVSGSAVTITSEQVNANPFNAVSSNINAATIDNISGVRYWNITKSGGSFTNAQVTLTYVSTFGNSDSVQLGSELRVAQLDGSNVWQTIGGTGSANWAGTITSNTFSDFLGGVFTFADALGGGDITLPVELAFFRLLACENEHRLTISWRTESEINNAYFLVQRMNEEKGFETIAQIRGQGSKTGATDYEYTDDDIQIGDTLSYRLADVAYDGSVTYHPAKSIIVHLPTEYRLLQNYPNPFNPVTTVVYHLPEASDVILTIYNVLGQRVKTLVDVKQQKAGVYRFQWNGLSDSGVRTGSGLYIIRMHTGKHTQTRKMLYMK